MKGRKAQTEIIGLAFVVVIAIFGLLVYVALNSSIETTDDLRQKELASSMLTTMAQVDVGNVKYEDLVVNCVARSEDCELMNMTTNLMLDELRDLNQNFEFVIKDSNDIEELIISEGCGIERQAVATQPISLYGTSEKLLLYLALCD